MNKIVGIVLAICYWPAYCVFFLLQVIARLLLSIAYFGLLDGRKACFVFKSIFKKV